MMSLTLDPVGLPRRLGMIATLTVLSCTVFVACQHHDAEIQTMRTSSADNVQTHHTEYANLVGRTGSSISLVAIIMAVALTRALIEYARLVLMLLTHAEAVRECYAHHCSVDTLNPETSPIHLAEVPRAADQHTPSISGETSGGYQHVRNDSISTNILTTPSHMSEHDDPQPHEHRQSQPDAIQPPNPSICACGEQDYLVAIEDDVRMPCVAAQPQSARQSAPVLLFDAKQHMRPGEHFTKPTNEIQAEAATSVHALDDEERVARHHFNHDLRPVTEISPIDTF